MALLDALLELSDAQTLSSRSSGNTNITTDVIDFGVDGEDGWGTAKGNEPGPLFMTVQVNVVMTGASAAINAILMTHTGVTVTSGSEVARILIPALSAAGWRRTIRVPNGQYKRYVGGNLSPSGGTIGAACAFDWWLHVGEGDTPIADTL